jgi:hypothetical protein
MDPCEIGRTNLVASWPLIDAEAGQGEEARVHVAESPG